MKFMYMNTFTIDKIWSPYGTWWWRWGYKVYSNAFAFSYVPQVTVYSLTKLYSLAKFLHSLRNFDSFAKLLLCFVKVLRSPKKHCFRLQKCYLAKVLHTPKKFAFARKNVILQKLCALQEIYICSQKCYLAKVLCI